MTDALLDAGLLPLDTGRPADADLIAARAYRHPQLGDRPVIRLVGQAVAPAEDAAMAFFGFDAPEAGEPLAAGRRRALGYPAWALVHDPVNAAVALSVVPAMEKTARLTSGRPGFAAAEYAELATKLPPSHLPAFWEQAGRAFIAAGNTGQAATAFARARAAELAHDLPVDEDIRREVYLEFAAGGGLTIKAIAEYTDDLRRRYPADRAYAEFVRLAERRTASGFAPWSGLPKQARALAKAAGLDVGEEELRLLAELLRMPATKHAPAGFWTAWRGALVKLAKRSPDARRKLLDLFPTAPDDDWWIDLLDAVAAFDLLLESEPGVPAAWMTQLARRRARDTYDVHAPAPKAYDLVPRLAARLIADARPVDVSLPRTWGPWQVDLDLLDTCLAAGIPIVPPPADREWIYLFDWLRSDGRRDLEAVAADPVCSPLLRKGVAYALSGRGKGHDRLLSTPALAPMARHTLDEWTATARSGGVLAARTTLSELDQTLGREFPAGMPDLAEQFATVDVATILARTLRAGIFDEYGWTALDDIAQQLAGPGRLGCSASWPVLTIWNATRAVAIGPDGPVAEHDLRLPAGHDITTVLYSGGQFLVIQTAGMLRGWTGYWSGKPAWTFPLDLPYHLNDTHGVLTDAGERLNGRQVLRPGDSVVHSDRPVLADGSGYWTTRDGQAHKLYEFDPETAAIGRASLPPAFAAVAKGEREILAETCWLRPLPAGPIGFFAGTGWVAAPDGHVVDGIPGNPFHDRPKALVRFPASVVEGVLRGYSDLRFTTLDGSSDHWQVLPGSPTHGTPLVPPAVYWPLLEPRDPAGSAALRQVSEPTAARLLAAVAEAGNNGAALAAAVARVMPEVTHPRLRLGIAGLTGKALELSVLKRRLLDRKPAALAQPATTDEADVVAGLHGLLEPAPIYGHRDDQPLAELSAISEVLAGAELPASGLPESNSQWLPLIGGAAAVAIRAAGPSFPPGVRAALLDVLDAWARSPFVRDDVEVIVGELETHAWPAVFRDRRDRNGVCVTLGLTNKIAGIRYSGKNPRIGAPVAELYARPLGWGSRGRIEAFVRQARAAGPMPWSPAAADTLAAGSGMSRAAARLLLAGLPGIRTHEQNFLDRDVRTRLGLRTREAVAGRNELRPLPRNELIALYGEAMPDDPAELWSEAGQIGFAERLAAAYTRRFGRSFSVASETIAAAQSLNTALSPSRLLGIAARPDDCAALTQGGQEIDGLILDLALLLPWAYVHLPAGDPVRHGLPRALELVRQRLADDRLLAEAGTLGPYDDIQGHVARILGSPAGDETVVVTYERWTPDVRFRPARLPQDDIADTPLGRLLNAFAYQSSPVPNAVLALRDSGYTEIAGRIDSAGLPPGGYEADPELSAPDVFAGVRSRLSLDTDAAKLYLQLLALPEPTDRNVRQWNAWKPAQHKQAIATLAEHGLVVEDKRARAGRSAFLPGAWVPTKAPNLPLERAKLDLLGLHMSDDGTIHSPLPRWLPLRPLPVLFAEAWQHSQDASGERR